MDDDPLIAKFIQHCDQIRHPALGLDLFLSHSTGPDVSDDEDDDAWSDEVDLTGVPEEELTLARARRGALLYAANRVFDRILDDYTALLGAPVSADEEESFADENMPRRFHRHYDPDFHRKLLATAAKVSQDLADPHRGYPACTPRSCC